MTDGLQIRGAKEELVDSLRRELRRRRFTDSHEYDPTNMRTHGMEARGMRTWLREEEALEVYSKVVAKSDATLAFVKLEDA